MPRGTAPAWHSSVVNPADPGTRQGKVGRIRTFREYNPATRQYGPEQPLPSSMLGAGVYWDLPGHGRPGEVGVVLEDGSLHWHKGEVHGQLVGRRGSFQSLPKAAAMNELVCWAAAPSDTNLVPHSGARAPFVADPLAPRLQAASQGLANSTRKDVSANLRVVGTYKRKVAGGSGYEFVVHTTPQWGGGGAASWQRAEPVPTRTKLRRLAAVAGLDPDSLRAVERLVYALRQALGEGIDHDPDYRALVRGIGVLEQMRRNDPLLRGFGPFSMDLFRWAAGEQRPAPSGAEPSRGEYLDLLLRAARQDSDARLTDFLRGTARSALRAAASRLSAMDQEAENALAVELQGLPEQQYVGGIERGRVLYAMARATAWMETVPPGDVDRLSAKVLHGQGSHDAAQQREELVKVAASVAAKGRDLYDERELAVGHLELSGAFGSGTAVSLPDNAAGGRSWRGDSQLTSWSPNGVLHYIRYGRRDVRWDRSAPPPQWTGAGAFSPYLLDPGVSALSGHVEMVLGGVALQVPFD
ncbi:lonely Cys domain-containing protein, partial [Streptomyces sp. NPDC048527]|uniref:lonely Cys domain-containing protein n=1 Tax=Streptomyces sp. NPDC048527 TaxID=3365568 RepID=UPI0037220323